MNSANAAARPATKPATGFASAFRDSGSRLRKNPKTGTFAVWRPIAPEGYVALGCVVTPTHDPPDPDRVACVRADLAVLSTPAPAPLWTTEGAESKLGAGKLSVYRTGVAATPAGWPSPTGTRVHGRTQAALGRGARRARRRRQRGRRGRRRADGWLGDGKRRDRRVRAVGGGTVDAGGVARARKTRRRRDVRRRRFGSVVVVDRRAGCVRAPATLVARDVPFALEARLVRVGGGLAVARRVLRRAPPRLPAAASRRWWRFSSRSALPAGGPARAPEPFDEFTRGTGRARADSASHFRDAAPRGAGAGSGPGPSTATTTWTTRAGRRQLSPAVASAARVAQGGLNATRRRRWTRRRALIGDDSTRSDASASVDGVTSARRDRRPLSRPRATPVSRRRSEKSRFLWDAATRSREPPTRTGPASSRRHGYGRYGRATCLRLGVRAADAV